MITYCKIVKVETESFWRTETWVLTHEYGKVEKRIKRRLHSRHIAPAPKQVKCNRESEADNG